MKKTENPNKKLELIIKDSDLPTLSKKFTEVVVDGFMDDGILKDLPLVSNVVGIVKFGNSINKHLAAKKIYKFLFELHKIPLQKRIDKIDEINKSPKYQSNVGEMIFELLERIESDGKPEIVGRIFAAVIEEKVDFSDYLKCTHIVKNMFYSDLEKLKIDHNNGEIKATLGDGILESGLIEISSIGGIGTTEISGTNLSELGKIVIEIGME